MYSSWDHGYNVFFDWYMNTGVDEKDKEEIASNLLKVNLAISRTPIVQYTVKRPGYVKITLQDITGRIVDIPVNGSKSPGDYSVMLKGISTSGVYFVRMVSPDGTYTKKITVLN